MIVNSRQWLLPKDQLSVFARLGPGFQPGNGFFFGFIQTMPFIPKGQDAF